MFNNKNQFIELVNENLIIKKKNQSYLLQSLTARVTAG